jgi:hypothetical protein
MKDYTDEQKARLFDALHADGVDNWEGYQMDNWQEVMEDIEGEEKYNETYLELEEMFEMIEMGIEVEEPSERGAGFMATINPEVLEDVVKFIIKKYK